jgi:hypothetical protein
MKRAPLSVSTRSAPGSRASRDERDITTRAFRVRASSLNEDARSVEGVIATESPVTVYSWRHGLIDEVLRMDGVEAPDQVPLLDSHWRGSAADVLGSTRDIRVEGAELIGLNIFDDDGEQGPASRVFGKVKRGHLRDFSVGYQVRESVEVKPGSSAEVNGKRYKAEDRSLHVVTRWKLLENSVTPIGADEKAKVRQERGSDSPDPDNSRRDGKENVMSFEQWLEKKGLRSADLGEDELARHRTEYEAETRAAAGDTPPEGGQDQGQAESQRSAPQEPATPPAPAPPAGDTDAATREIAAAAVTAERERCRLIRAEASGLGIDDDVVSRQIDDGNSLEQARAAFLSAVRARTPSVGAPNLNVGAGDPGRTVETLAAGLCIREGFTFEEMEGARVGLREIDAPSTREDLTRWFEQGHRYRDLSLIDVCREVLAIEGQRVPFSREETIRAAFGTLSISTLLSNVTNKAVLVGFRLAPNTSLTWCRLKSVRDFKLQTRVQTSDGEDWEVVNGNGEIAEGTISELAETYRIDTYAKMLTLRRQDIIDDDLGELTGKGRRMGNAGMRTIDNLVYTHLLANGNLSDGVALFHATHANYDGSSGALADATLAAAKTKIRKQKGLDGEALNIEPTYLIVVPELEHTAARLIHSAEMRAVGDDETYHGTYNVHKGKFKLVVESRLSNSAYTGYDVDQWFLAASPAQADTIEIGFLNGVKRPTVEKVAVPSNVLGIRFRGFIDLGVKALNHRGLYCSKGA